MQAETTIVKLFGGSEIDPVADPYTIYKRLRSERPAACSRASTTSSRPSATTICSRIDRTPRESAW